MTVESSCKGKNDCKSYGIMIDPTAAPPLKYQMCYSVPCKLSWLYHNCDLYKSLTFIYLLLCGPMWKLLNFSATNKSDNFSVKLVLLNQFDFT